jgi:hypothetical protein
MVMETDATNEGEKPRTLPGAFDRKISHQAQLSQPGLLTGGLAFSKAKNQMHANGFGSKKKSE